MLISSPWQRKIKKQRLTRSPPWCLQRLPAKARFGIDVISFCELDFWVELLLVQTAAVKLKFRAFPPLLWLFAVCTRQTKLQFEIHAGWPH